MRSLGNPQIWLHYPEDSNLFDHCCRASAWRITWEPFRSSLGSRNSNCSAMHLRRLHRCTLVPANVFACHPVWCEAYMKKGAFELLARGPMRRIQASGMIVLSSEETDLSCNLRRQQLAKESLLRSGTGVTTTTMKTRRSKAAMVNRTALPVKDRHHSHDLRLCSPQVQGTKLCSPHFMKDAIVMVSLHESLHGSHPGCSLVREGTCKFSQRTSAGWGARRHLVAELKSSTLH